MIVATLAQALHMPVDGPVRVDTHAFDSLADIAAYAREKNERIVWLAADEPLDSVINDPETWDGAEVHGSIRHSHWGTFRLDGRDAVTIQNSLDPRWQLRAEDRHLLPLGRLLGRMRYVLGDEPAYSPASTGLSLLRRWLAARRALFPSAWAAFDPPVAIAARGLHFLHPGRYTGQTRLFLMDRTAAYLNAARNASFGLTGMYQVETTSYEPRAYGAWEIDDWEIPPGVAHLTPLPRRGPAWVMTNVLVWLDEIGVKYRISRARLWPTRHRLMRDWAEGMIMARAIHPMGKAMANGAMGMFASRSGAKERSWWYRPDWRAHIVATNTMTTGRTIRRLEQEGYAVIGAFEDMICIASDDLAPPAFFSERQTVIGGWHLQATYQGGNYSHAVQALKTSTNIVGWLGVLHAH